MRRWCQAGTPRCRKRAEAPPLPIQGHRARKHRGKFLAGTSYGGGKLPDENVVKASDFLLLQGNGVAQPERIAEMVRQARQVAGYRAMPVLFNEDDHFDFDKPVNNLVAAVGEYASWGYFDYRMRGEGFDDGENWSASSPRKRAFFKLLAEIIGETP